MGCLYIIESPSGKKYIGITAQTLSARWRAHKSHANRNVDGVLQKAIRKYGAKEMSVKTLVISNDYEYLKALEISAIRNFGTKVPSGYNMTDGGDGTLGIFYTESNRENRKKAQKISWSDDNRRAIHLASQRDAKLRLDRSNRQKIRMSDPEYRKKISDKLKSVFSKPEIKEKLLNRPKRQTIDDGLTRCQRYRLKDLDAYRKRKREWAKTPDQRKKRADYMRLWNARKKSERMLISEK